MMHWPDIVAIATLVMTFVMPIWHTIRTIRANELKSLIEGQKRIEGKLDAHIQWHVDHSAK